MTIESIELKNYRNYEELHMELSQGTLQQAPSLMLMLLKRFWPLTFRSSVYAWMNAKASKS